MFPIRPELFTMTDSSSIGNTKVKEVRHDDMVKIEKFWAYFHKFWLRNPSFIVTQNVFGHYQDEKMKLQRTNNGLERYNRSLNDKFSGKQSLLSFIKILEHEARGKVRELEDIRIGLVVNKRNRNDDGDEMENGRELKVPTFYYSFNPDEN